MFGKPLSLHSTTLNKREIIVTDLPYPPQLKQAMGYKTNVELLGIWYLVDGRLSITDGYGSRGARVPAWTSYSQHPTIYPYFLWLRGKYQFYGSEEEGTDAPTGFILDDRSSQIYLSATVQISDLLQEINPDIRPDWLKSATYENANNPEFKAKYLAYLQSTSPMFPALDPDCHHAQQQMLTWLSLYNLDLN